MIAFALALALQDAVVVERTVTVTTIDVLNRRREVRRRERLVVRGADLSVTDLTFGERLIVRSDVRKVWKADPLAGTYAELGFDEVARLRQALVDELLSCKARVAGTPEEKDLEAVLEGLDRSAKEPSAELRATGAKREIVLNGDRVRLSADVDPSVSAPGYFEALGALGAFPPVVGAKLKELGGFPVKGTFRYVLFGDRVVEQFETHAAKAQAVSPAEFELPAGLTKVPLAGLQKTAEKRPSKPPDVKKSFGEDDGDRKEREEQ